MDARPQWCWRGLNWTSFIESSSITLLGSSSTFRRELDRKKHRLRLKRFSRICRSVVAPFGEYMTPRLVSRSLLVQMIFNSMSSSFSISSKLTASQYFQFTARYVIGVHRDKFKDLVVIFASTIQHQTVRLLLPFALIFEFDIWTSNVHKLTWNRLGSWVGIFSYGSSSLNLNYSSNYGTIFRTPRSVWSCWNDFTVSANVRSRGTKRLLSIIAKT